MIDKEITMSSAEKARMLANLKRGAEEVEKPSLNTTTKYTGNNQKNILDAFHQRYQAKKIDTKNDDNLTKGQNKNEIMA